MPPETRPPLRLVPVYAAVVSFGLLLAWFALSATRSGTHHAAAVTIPPITDVTAFVEQCPTNDPVYAQIRSDFEIRREGVPVGAIACTEPISAMPISQYTDELILVQTLRLIYYLEGGRAIAYPWTSGSYYDWLKSQIGGVDLRLNGSYCCSTYDGDWYPVLATQNDFDRHDARKWQGLSVRIALLGHEARHVSGYPHVGGCPLFPQQGYGCDAAYDASNLSPYGFQYWLPAKWLSGELDMGYACLGATVRNQIGNWHAARGNEYVGRFVENSPPLLTLPTQPGGTCGSPTPTAVVTPTASPASTLSPTLTASPNLTPTPTPTPSASQSPTPTASQTLTPTVTLAPSPTLPDDSPSASPSGAPSDVSATPTPLDSGPLPPPGSTNTPAQTPVDSPTPERTEEHSVTATPMPSPEGPGPDLDCDGRVDLQDAIALFRTVSGTVAAAGCGGPGEGDRLRGDVDCDGDVDAADGLWILRFLARLTNAPGVCGG